MTKVELRKWAESEKKIALEELNEKYTQKENACIEQLKVDMKFYEFADKLQQKATEIDAILDDYKKNLPQGIELYDFRGSLHFTACRYARDGSKELNNDTPFLSSKKRTDIYKEYQIVRERVRENYNALIENINSFANAKKAIEYLVSIGYDVNLFKDEQVMTTALVCQVDVNYLNMIKEE